MTGQLTDNGMRGGTGAGAAVAPSIRLRRINAPGPLAIHRHDGASDLLVVVFSSIGANEEEQPPEMVRSAIGEAHNHALFISDTSRSWLNAEGLEDKIAAAVHDAREGSGALRLALVGISMGGFMACALAERLGADVVVAFTPQYSLSDEVVPGEFRWRPYRAAVAEWRRLTVGPLNRGKTRYFILHGDGPLETLHWSRFPRGERIKHLIIRGGGHAFPGAMKNKQLLAPFLAAAFTGAPRVAARVLSRGLDVVLRSELDPARGAARASVNVKGVCACGACEISATTPDVDIEACHCAACRRWAGGGPMLLTRVENPEMRGVFTRADHPAPHGGTRIFCAACATPMAWSDPETGKDFVAVGCLSETEGFAVAREAFVDKRPHWATPIFGARQYHARHIRKERAKAAPEIANGKGLRHVEL